VFYTSVTEVVSEAPLVKTTIDYKILFITYKALRKLAPDYIKELLVEYKPSRSLRSSTQNLLAVPPTRSKTGIRAFQVAAPKLWNSMPAVYVWLAL